MKNINKNKKARYFYLLIAIFICVYTLYKYETGQLNINNIFNEIINNNIDVEREKENINKSIALAKKESKNEIIHLKIEVINAYLKYHEKKYNQSIKIIDRSLKQKSIRENDRILFEMYSLKYLNYIYLNDGKAVNKTFNILLDIAGNNKNIRQELVNLFIDNIEELNTIKGGITLSASLLPKLISISKTLNENVRFELYRIAGNIYIINNRLDLALLNQIRGLRIAFNCGDEEKKVSMLLDIAANYMLQENYNEAIDTLEKIMKNDSLNTSLRVDLLSYLSVGYIKINDYEKAEDTLYELSEEIEGLDDNLKQANKMWMYIYWADINTKNDRYEKAKQYLNLASDLYKKYNEISFPQTDISILIEYGDLYYKQEEYEKALRMHLKAYEIAEDMDIKNISKDILEAIYNDYYKLGEYRKAYEITNKISEISSYELKIRNVEKSNNIYQNIMIEDQDIEISALSNKQTNFKIIIIVLIITTSIFYFNIIIIKNKKNKVSNLNKELIVQNKKDSLTGIYNRRALDDYIENMEFKEGTDNKYAIFMIDIDYFKLYNDNYGHVRGDEILIQVAHCIDEVSAEHIVARYGGEEFIVLMKYKSELEIENLAKNIYRKLELSEIEHKYSKISDKVTLSTGICYGEVEKEDIMNVMIQADKALYISKENGRNRYTIEKFERGIEEE